MSNAEKTTRNKKILSYPEDFIRESAPGEELCAEDPANQLRCFITTAEKSPLSIVQSREFVKRMYHRAGYDGYDDSHDKMFDHHSTYLLVRNKQNKLVATIKMIHKTPNTYLPLELGIINNSHPKRRYVCEEYGSLEINSFCMTSSKAATLAIAACIKYLMINEVPRLYCIHDPSSKLLAKLYLSFGFLKSPDFNEGLYFPGYGNDVSELCASKPTIWQVLEATRKEVLENKTFVGGFDFVDTILFSRNFYRASSTSSGHISTRNAKSL